MAKNSTFAPTDTSNVWIAEAPGFHESTDPTVAVFGGVHGDEQTGIRVVNHLLENGIDLDAGRIIIGLGNLAAIAQNVRGTEHEGRKQNLNREFMALDDPHSRWGDVDPERWPYEVTRAQELLPYLRRSDGLLDLHDFTDPKGPIFMVTEQRGFSAARAIGAPVISSGWSEAEPGGSDYFMEMLEKIGICYELGVKTQGELNFDRGMGAVTRFLISQGMFEGQLPPLFAEQGSPRYILNEKSFKLITDGAYELLLPEGTKTFDPLSEGQPIANLDGAQIRAQKGQVIIFPTKPENAHAGGEVFSVGREFTPAA